MLHVHYIWRSLLPSPRLQLSMTVEQHAQLAACPALLLLLRLLLRLLLLMRALQQRPVNA